MQKLIYPRMTTKKKDTPLKKLTHVNRAKKYKYSHYLGIGHRERSITFLLLCIFRYNMVMHFFELTLVNKLFIAIDFYLSNFLPSTSCNTFIW